MGADHCVLWTGFAQQSKCANGIGSSRTLSGHLCKMCCMRKWRANQYAHRAALAPTHLPLTAIAPCWTAVQGQLQQLRQALGLAVALNRTIIMPKVGAACLSVTKADCSLVVRLAKQQSRRSVAAAAVAPAALLAELACTYFMPHCRACDVLLPSR